MSEGRLSVCQNLTIYLSEAQISQLLMNGEVYYTDGDFNISINRLPVCEDDSGCDYCDSTGIDMDDEHGEAPCPKCQNSEVEK